jgi:hypothetical protein
MSEKVNSKLRKPPRRAWRWGDGASPFVGARIGVETLAAVDAHARAVGVSRSFVIAHALSEWARRQSEAA